MAADLDNKSSLESAFAGAHVIFLVSDYCGTLGVLSSRAGPDQSKYKDLEAAEIGKEQLTNAIDTAAQFSSSERLVLSSLQNASDWSGGKYEPVYDFEFKARAADYAAKTYPELWAKTSIFPGGYLEEGCNPTSRSNFRLCT